MRCIFSEMLADTEGEVLDAPFDTMKERTVAREIVTEKLPAARAMVAAYDEIRVRHRRQPRPRDRRARGGADLPVQLPTKVQLVINLKPPGPRPRHPGNAVGDRYGTRSATTARRWRACSPNPSARSVRWSWSGPSDTPRPTTDAVRPGRRLYLYQLKIPSKRCIDECVGA